MNGLSQALIAITTYLDAQRIPYMVIGGFANLQWGQPRVTEDLDITVLVPEPDWDRFISDLGSRFRILIRDPLSFARESRVLPLLADHVRVDLIFAGLPFEEEAIRRAVPIAIEDSTVRFCTAEDLIVHKLVSERQRDQDDVRGIILRQAGRLDRAYLDPRVREIAQGLERPSIEDFYRACLEEAVPPG